VAARLGREGLFAGGTAPVRRSRACFLPLRTFAGKGTMFGMSKKNRPPRDKSSFFDLSLVLLLALSAAACGRTESAFAQHDADHDGYIDREEWRELVVRTFAYDKTSPQEAKNDAIDKIMGEFHRLDRNGDDKIDESEFPVDGR
jgi:hypothetical protein